MSFNGFNSFVSEISYTRFLNLIIFLVSSLLYDSELTFQEAIFGFEKLWSLIFTNFQANVWHFCLNITEDDQNIQ